MLLKTFSLREQEPYGFPKDLFSGTSTLSGEQTDNDVYPQRKSDDDDSLRCFS
jgi:hypothetical protein